MQGPPGVPAPGSARLTSKHFPRQRSNRAPSDRPLGLQAQRPVQRWVLGNAGQVGRGGRGGMEGWRRERKERRKRRERGMEEKERWEYVCRGGRMQQMANINVQKVKENTF